MSHELVNLDVIFMCAGCERVNPDGTCPLKEVTKLEQKRRAEVGNCEDAIINGGLAARVKTGGAWVNRFNDQRKGS